MDNLNVERQSLIDSLQTAVLLELSTIPPYLMALLSIKPQANRVAANIIRGVMMEEMLHMILAGNLIASLDGIVELGAEALPSYPLSLEFEGKKFRDREFDVHLLRFSPRAIDTFMRIELPTELAVGTKKTTGTAEIEIPGITIGEFYESVEAKLVELCEAYSEAEVFSGDPARQVDINYYWSGGGQAVTITDLATAKKAINVIVAQGEGCGRTVLDGDRHYFDQRAEVAHYFSFKEIKCARRYQPGDNPCGEPTGEEFDVDYAAVYPIKEDPKSSDYANDPHMSRLNDSFNIEYSEMIQQIAQSFNGTPEVLYIAIVNGMNNLTRIAEAMVSTPIAGNEKREHGAPSFEWRTRCE